MTWLIYPACLIGAIVTGLWITESFCENRPLARKLYIFGIIGGFIGSSLFTYLVHGDISKGTSSYGFAFGAIIFFSSCYYWIHREWADTDFLDALAPASAFGIGLFRIGCYFAGCCFGTISDCPWCVHYGPDSFAHSYQVQQGVILQTAGGSLPVHPVQLYESFVAFIGFILILAVFRIRSKEVSSPSQNTEQEPGPETVDGQNKIIKPAKKSDKVRPGVEAGHCQWLPILQYEIFLSWIAYYGIWRIVSVPLRAGSGSFLSLEQTVWSVSTALAVAIIIVRRRRKSS